jgi:hypothetical protein
LPSIYGEEVWGCTLGAPRGNGLAHPATRVGVCSVTLRLGDNDWNRVELGGNEQERGEDSGEGVTAENRSGTGQIQFD